MNDCVFCSIVAKNDPPHEIWWSDEDHLAFLDIKPIQKGHTLVIPKKHVQNVLDMPGGEYGALMQAAKALGERMRPFFGVERIGMIVEGFGVNHAHVHLVPLSGRGQLEYAPILELSPEEFSELGARLRTSVS